jgi:tetratricopeptide (TPR) repeat protein
MDLHRWPAAAEQLMDAEKADPSNPFEKMNNAMLQLATDKPAEALRIAEAVAIENPDLLPAKSLLAFVLLENGKSAEAAALANEVIKADNSDVVAHVVAARILRNEGKFDDALLQLNHAQNNGDGATSFLQIELADTLLAKGDIAKATTAAQFALQLAPASLDAKHALARTLERQGNWEGAALYLRELSARKPKDLAAKLELANALVQSGDPVGAQLTYEAAEKLAPDSRDVLLGLSKVATMQGNKRLSRSLLRRAEKIQSPSSSNSATRATNPSQPR